MKYLLPICCLLFSLLGRKELKTMRSYSFLLNTMKLLILGYIFSTLLLVFFLDYSLYDGIQLFFHMPPYLLLFTPLGYYDDILSVYPSYFVGILIAIGIVWWQHKNSKSTNRFDAFGNARFGEHADMVYANLFSDNGIIIGEFDGETLRAPGFESVLVAAPTGSGKTTCIAIPNLLEWSGSVVANDLKGELYRSTAQHRTNALAQACYQWAPADERRKSHRFNPFAYVSKNQDFWVRDLQQIAEVVIPATQLGDAFWYQSSRELFITLALYLFLTEGIATLEEIHNLGKQDNLLGWLQSVIEDEDITHPLFRQNAQSLLQSDERVQKNIIKDFHSRMSIYADPIVQYATSGNDFDLRDLRRKKMSIYITIPDADKERLKPILTLFWTQLINAMTYKEPEQKDEPHPVLALMDEFGAMARIDKLKDGVSFLRSYRVRPVIILQHLGQLNATYGRDNARSFLNSKVKVAFSLNDIEDARYFSDCMGKKTIKVHSNSSSSSSAHNNTGQSTHEQYQPWPLMTPDELMRLDKNKCVILLEGHRPVLANKLCWIDDNRCVENYKNQHEQGSNGRIVRQI